MRKLVVNPVHIPLNELPAEGRQFVYTQESGELNKVLKDLIGSNSFKVDLEIRPIGNAYEVKGHIYSSMDLSCSRCALDFKHSINEKVKEVLVVTEALGRTAHMAKVNHANELDEAAPQCIILESEVFDVGEYVHEIIALAEPIRPLAKPNCDDSCENLTELYQKGFLTKPEQETNGIKEDSPFSVLKNFKITN